MPDSAAPTPARRRALLALLLVVPVPSLGAYVGLIASPGAFGQAVFLASKLWILIVPWAFVRFVDRERVRPTWRCPGWRVSLATGLLFAGGMITLYAGWARHAFDLSQIGPTVAAAGLDTRTAYIGLAVYWTFINALIEEYVWRWFVARKCELLVPRGAAIVLAALCFSLHHYIAIVSYVSPGAALFATAGVFGASLVWSWLYLRYRSVLTPYISHVLADAAIFAIGYVIIFGS